MALNGTDSRFVSATTVGAGTPGGQYQVTVIAVPVTSYPANGEPIATFLLDTAANGGLADSRIKVPAGVKPDAVYISSSLGHPWGYDSSQGTMGTLRQFTAISNTPTEHATAAYDGNEASEHLRITFCFPLFGDMSR